MPCGADTVWCSPPCCSFLVTALRTEFELDGVPIRLVCRASHNPFNARPSKGQAVGRLAKSGSSRSKKKCVVEMCVMSSSSLPRGFDAILTHVSVSPRGSCCAFVDMTGTAAPSRHGWTGHPSVQACGSSCACVESPAMSPRNRRRRASHVHVPVTVRTRIDRRWHACPLVRVVRERSTNSFKFNKLLMSKRELL